MQVSTPSKTIPQKQISPLWRHFRFHTIGDLGTAGFILWALVLFVFVLFFGLPLLWLLIAPSKFDTELFQLSPLAFGSFQKYFEAWKNLGTFNSGEITTWAMNSIFYVMSSLILALIITVPAGYILAISRFPGRTMMLWLTIISMMLPGSALVLPLFLEMNLVHLVNTSWAVILPAIFFPFGVYLTYTYFATSLPPDLLDAARVDGCSESQLFLEVGLPLSKPLLGLLAFISFNGNWNNYFGPFVMLNDDKLYNLPVGVQALIAGTNALRPTISASDLPLHRAEVAMAGLVMVLPVVLVFLFSQRYVVSGAFTGSIKG